MTWRATSARPMQLATSYDVCQLKKRGFKVRLMTWRATSARPIQLATSYDVCQLKKRGFRVRLMTWRATSGRPYHEEPLHAVGAGEQGLTLVHFSAQRKHFL